MKKIIIAILVLVAVPVIAYIGFYTYAVYFYETDPVTRAYIDEQDPVKKLELLEGILDEDAYSRWAWLDNAAELAYKNEDYEKAKRYSMESLSLSAQHANDWNYGNSIHNANTVLGRISLRAGDTEAAKDYLLQAAASEGSPQLNTFGPNVTLANELLQAGEADAVLTYLNAIATFWEMDDGKVADWIESINNGERPTLSNCRCE